MSLEALDVDVDALASDGPRRAIPELTARLLDAWDTARARRFANVLLREGAGSAGRSGLTAAVETARRRLEPPFRAWQEAGLLRRDVRAEQLVWELFTPLNTIRLLYLHADATGAERAGARRLADEHVTFFLTCATATQRR